MKAKRFYNGKEGSVLSGITVGVLMSLLALVLGSMVLAKLLSTEWIPESAADYGVMILLIMVSYIGASISYGRIRNRRLWICLSFGAAIMLILLGITAVIFDGQYAGVGSKVMLIFCGCMLAVLPGMRTNRGGEFRKLKIPNG